MTAVSGRIVVLGATGLTGAKVAEALDALGAETVRASRHSEVVRRWQDEGHQAVHLDLDDPRTFPAALDGAHGLFLTAGYTSAMTHQAKTVVDAAVDAGVRHVVHLGIFGNGRTTDPHFAWHELVERYIEGSGLAWTHLHPHNFMENLLTSFRLRGDTLLWPVGDKPLGFVANEDLAAVAATVLAEGPDVHGGKGYWLSTDLLDGPRLARELTEALGRTITARILTPDELIAAAGRSTPAGMDDAYAASVVEYLRQNFDGRMDYAAVTTTTVEEVLGRPPVRFATWAARRRDALLASSR
ncbi:NmrA family NAD(P)-binding protein [Streptomyces sp. NPDC088387]|uniref:NmrA family NAD(P)-binding protein n=1 Tax=Streptomyces sp. NPDC088387 TaxID=3365859 RepID=UPI0037F192A5